MWKDLVQMELRGDVVHEGQVILEPRSWTKHPTEYPWDYWIGLSLWTGEYLYFKNGWDFNKGPSSFRHAVRAASVPRQIKFHATVKNLPLDEIKVAWFYEPKPHDPWEGVEVNEDLMKTPWPDFLTRPENLTGDE